MSRDDVIRMAREAGAEIQGDRIVISPGALWAMLNGAAYDSAEEEHEACAKLAASHPMPYGHCQVSGHAADMTSASIARAIRARKADQ